MHFRKTLNPLLQFFVIMSIICFSIQTDTGIDLSLGDQTEYTYYGVVPVKLYRYNLTDGRDRNSGWQLQSSANMSLLTIVAANDDTNVQVFDLTRGKSNATRLNTLDKFSLLLANGTFFKVVSDKIVTVELLDYSSIPTVPPPLNATGPLPHTFYTSKDGLYVGKEFVFMASQYTTDIYYAVLAIEKSTVTVTKDYDTSTSFTLEANSYKTLMLSPFRNYKITSTGNIMLQSGGGDLPGYGGECHCYAVPSAEGGFVGTFFLAMSVTTWDRIMDFGYRVSSAEDTTAKVFDLETKKLIMQLSVLGGIGVAFKPSANAIAVQSDKPITLSLVHNGTIDQMRPLAGGNPRVDKYSGYGEGILFIGVRPNEETEIFLPVNAQNNLFIFASEDTQVSIDNEITQTISADSYYLYTIPGTHKITSTKNIIVEINHWNGEPDYQGIRFTGTILPCIQTVNINPAVTLTSMEGGFPITYIIIGGAAAAVVIVAVLLVMRRRSSKPS